MNRHGIKLHLDEIRSKMKIGEKKLGSVKFGKLKRRKLMYENLLRYKHPKKAKK